jgi:hypothetical protein
MDPNAGIARIWWHVLDNDDLPAKEGKSTVRVHRFCGYTHSQFRAVSTEEYNFYELNQVISSFEHTKGVSAKPSNKHSGLNSPTSRS